MLKFLEIASSDIDPFLSIFGKFSSSHQFVNCSSKRENIGLCQVTQFSFQEIIEDLWSKISGVPFSNLSVAKSYLWKSKVTNLIFLCFWVQNIFYLNKIKLFIISLPGLISRWTIFWLCRCLSPIQISRIIWRIFDSLNLMCSIFNFLKLLWQCSI